jgi:hypothetical protein
MWYVPTLAYLWYLVPPLALPSSVATVSSPSVVLLVVVLVRELLLVVVVIIVVHLVPCCWWRSLLASAARRAWRAVTPLAMATVDPEEVDIASAVSSCVGDKEGLEGRHSSGSGYC